ncbi:MAG TPA: PDZ domain-containing protein [Candidatus Eisenbergiella merdigallinarum]|uniref:PDZ domain-containing protein n=1 Tax=Candidatus Eisenbergiella merdigallinarum TaxID=2838552 RepID=A0A9D2SE95_9FIRM|nr:PDZ domain-containing protein [Candidatus Eisenbergiella merdigallinarum]
MSHKRSFAGGLIAGIVLTLFLGCGYFAGTQLYRAFQAQKGAVSASGDSQDGAVSVANPATMQKMGVLEEMIGEYYLEDAGESELEQGVYKGMIEALGDPYSTYYSQEELEDLQNKTQGIYYGIGARVGIDADTQLPRIASVIEGTPAQEAGLMSGDLLYKVDDTLVQGMDLNSAVALVKGDEGTTVHLTVIREGETDYLEFDVERRKLENETVTYEMLEDGAGYIQIQEFDDVTVDQFEEALEACRQEGMRGLILDLRGNPGGNLTTVCEIARMMLPEGLIVYTEDKNGQREEYTCDGKSQLDVPLVVLVDANSASASEILAGAVKDYGIGTLVGTTTFGKGIVQRIMKLSDGSAVKLTVSKYYTPKGNNIHEIGISPDVEVPFEAEPYLEDGTDNQLERALEVLKEKME